MAEEQFAPVQNGPLTFKAGIVNMKAYRLVHITHATGVVNYAFDEANVNGITLNNGELVGDAITVKMLPAIGDIVEVKVVDTGARGANLYLDEQADQPSATGLVKFTIGTATKELFIANQAVANADAAGKSIPAYQTNEINNMQINA